MTEGDPLGVSESSNPETALTNRLNALEQAVQEAMRKLEILNAHVSSAETSNAKILEHQRAAADALTTVQAKEAEIANTAQLATAARTQIADNQAVIATKSDHIQQAQEHADKVRGDLDRLVTAATAHVTEVEGLKARAQTASDAATDLSVKIAAAKTLAEASRDEISGMQEEAEMAAATTKDLASKSANIENKISGYEKDLEKFRALYEQQLKNITGLLPGATSAGLAHAFDQRRKAFMKPSARWQWLFIGSITVLVILAASGLWHVYTEGVSLTYDELLRLWLARLPIAAALVWLALYSGHESALAKRLEEDYGYKAAIASSFLGFHEQMKSIGEAAGPDTPLAKLCSDTLATLASPPGRIYEKHNLVATPTKELAELLKEFAEKFGKPAA